MSVANSFVISTGLAVCAFTVLVVTPAYSGQGQASFALTVALRQPTKLPPLEQLCRDRRTQFMGAVIQCECVTTKESKTCESVADAPAAQRSKTVGVTY